MLLGRTKQGLKFSVFQRARKPFSMFLFSSLIILGIGFMLPFAKTQKTAEALVDLTGDSTITMETINSSAAVFIDPSKTGVFVTTSGSSNISFSVATTNYTGYTLSARSTKTTLDKDTSSFLSLASSVTAEQFGNSSNTTLNNRWGYKPSFYNSETNDRYFGASTTAVTLDHTSTANATAKSYTIALGARADVTIPSGSYINNNFILETVANVVPSAILTISYGAHVTGVTIGGTPVANGETVKLIVGLPYNITMTTEQNFSLASWTATSGTIASASSTSTSYTITSSNATLTATGLFDGPNIQNLSSEKCTSTPRLVIDTRDERIYQVKRLEDGRCWMMENLDLGRTALTTDLTSTNTNVTTTVPYATFNGWIKSVGSWTVGAGELIPVTGSDPVSNVPYGTLYNYYAASAGTISGYSNANNAVNDVCPAGWRMPIGGTDGEFAGVYAYHDSYNNMRASESSGGLAYPLSGAFVQSAPESIGLLGIYWASTLATTSIWTATQYDVTMQELYITDATEEPIVIPEPSVFLGDSDYRMLGIAIRCIRKKPTHTLTINYGAGVQAVYVNGNLIANSGTVEVEEGFPQPIKVLLGKNYSFNAWASTSGTIAATSEQFTTYVIGSSNATLTASGTVFTGGIIQNLDSIECTTTARKFKDIRDNQVYTVKRLADGRCWMMENLNLGSTNLTVDLTSTNSNLSTTVTASTFNSWITNSPTSNYDSGVVVPIDGIDLSSNTPKATYYNFYAATGGTIFGSSNANNSTYDICPAGWRLPTGGATSELGAIYDNYHENAMIRAPLVMNGAAFGLTGGFSGTTINSDNGYGYYWSSTRSSTTNMRYLMVFQTGSNDVSTINRRNGASIRCILDQKTISELAYLQDFASLTNEERQQVSTSMLEGKTYQLTDNRDSKVYNIAKMKDGRIWLAENLDLGRTTLSSNLTSANTNLNTTIPYATFNGWKKTTGTMTYVNGEFINVTGTDEASGTAYGTLYNYYAATAGTVNGSESSKDAAFDICPAGWRLPTGGSSGEFQTLYTQYPSNARMRAPIAESGAAFTLAGVFYGGAPTYQETNGRLWSLTRVDDTNVNINFMSTTGVSPASTNGRRDGCSIRCIVKTDVYTLTVSYGTGVSSVEVNDITIQNGGTVNLESGFNNSITITLVPGYSFTGWSATSGTIGESSAQSTTYAIGSANATLTATATFTAPNIQNLDPEDCTSTQSYAVDTRDNHLYAIKRLNDGNCWMMENLDLGRTTLTTDLTSSNTNLSTTITASIFNAWKTMTGSGTNDTGEFINVSGTDSTSNTLYGTLYNYYATSAGTISGSTNSNKARYDICPAGWRLPTGGASGEFVRLYAEYNSNALMRAPYTESGAAFALAGWFNDSSAELQGENGFYWTSTRADDAQMNVLYLSTSYVSAESNSYRNSGRSIRCVLKKPTHTLTVSYGTGITDVTVNGISVANGGTMSLEEGMSYDISTTISSGYSFTSWSATSGTVGSTSTQTTTYTIGSSNATLTASASFNGPNIQNLASSSCTTTASLAKDIRDNHIYTIQRLNDGNCWMMENLDLGRTTLTTDLTSANTNLATTVTASTFNSWKKTTGTNTYDAGEFINVTGTDSTSGTPYGTLYNFYAASAGTVYSEEHYGNFAYDICPAGWRLPTGTTYGEFSKLIEQYNSLALMTAPISNNGAAFARSGYFFNDTTQALDRYGYYISSTASQNRRYKMGLSLTTTSVSANEMLRRSYGYSIRCILKEGNPTYKTLTVVYDEGVRQVKVDGQIITNGGTINLEVGVPYAISMSVISPYAFSGLSVSSGTISSTTSSGVYYVIGTSNDTLVVSTYWDGTDMQNYIKNNCTSTARLTKDNRDGHIYTIQRLADGNCWMMENLDLGRSALTTDLTSANTNLATTVTASTFNSWKKASGTGTYDAGEFINVTGTDSTSGTPYGTLYNYYAASAGTISGSSNSNNAIYDICPAGWRLPTGGSSGEFQALYTEYNSNALMRASIANSGAAFALAGYFSRSTPANQGSDGYYWSSTRYNNTAMHDLSLGTAEVTPADAGYRSGGEAIRCVLKKPTHTLTISYGTGITDVTVNGISVANGGTMSLEEGMSYDISTTISSGYSFTSWSATSGTVGSTSAQTTTYSIDQSNATITASATFTFSGPNMQNLASSSCTTTPLSVRDTRDNHIYTVQRLSDGKCWMMENLDLGRTAISTNLTSTNTNLATTITASVFNNWKKNYGTGTYIAGEYINVSGTDATTGTQYGTLYNYYAATAGTISGNTNSGDATYDICPAGWRLPTGGSWSGEFQDLYTQYNSHAQMRAPFSENGAAFALAGNFYLNTQIEQGNYGYYWSSARRTDTTMYGLYIDTASVAASASADRAYGSAIRCVLK